MLLKILLYLRDRIRLVDTQENVHGLFGTIPHVTSGIRIRSKQKRNSEERSISVNLTLDTGAVPVYFHFRRHGRYLNQVPIAYVIEDCIRRHPIGEPRAIGNRESLADIGIRANQSHDLLLSVWCSVHGKRHANSARFQYPWDTGGHLPDSTVNGSSKLKCLHSSRGNPNIGVAGINKSGCRSQKTGQETALKNHQKYGKRHTEHRYRKAGSVVNDILPGKFHIKWANEKFAG